ncbi:MAG: 50S ribosomal protein L30 [Candidatus Thermoplasmatota archaeon]|jgi:large subunit ribosomal protein L30|nr:50S ribosomal protein L30 [Candidatus Thermoplasmatota archaeon]MCL5790224.1 50S ribosomal protein L30 [Candidatus Thermoplasmatota archaeon]
MLAVIKVRGSNKTEPGIRMAFKELRLNKNNHLVLVDESQIGQIRKAKDYVTWGEIDEEHLVKLLHERGRITGNKPLDESFLKERGFASLNDLASKLLDGSIKVRDIESMKPVFRMNPPRRGYHSTKRTFNLKGALGYRGKDINKLIDAMLEGGKNGQGEN